MRISISPDDPGYSNYLRYSVDYILLDGQVQDKAITADEDTGYILRHKEGPGGLYILQPDKDRVATEKEEVKGVVRIKYRSRPYPLPDTRAREEAPL